MQNKKISIVIPIYNEGLILEKEINNLFQEISHKLPLEYNDLELILVENGSTDNTLEIAKDLLLNFLKSK